ncbi:RNA helicase [Adhaeribacter soli]|uniref:RNA helicase n=1 Tax=Adhaeribacter soli TaxID=2607655 RepID=A0A5N1IL43_9BACT|nr:RNA helicase [Adhaeribacter soli]KAA9325374.1 RNA helicase [Adhaeribacter soli]
MPNNKAEPTENIASAEVKKPTCGIIMPISAIGGLSKEHWVDVKSILYDIIEGAGFEPNLVSDGSDVGVIQNRIISNIYNSNIVVCDVSEKNPNVMFELGLRLAFDKPTIIIKDDLTGYSFDTSPIEHLDYPRDLRYNLIEGFKENLKLKLVSTYKKSVENSEYTTFLGHFGNYKASKIEDKEVSGLELIMKSFEELRQDLYTWKKSSNNNPLGFDENVDVYASSAGKAALEAKEIAVKYILLNNIKRSDGENHEVVERIAEYVQSEFNKKNTLISRNLVSRVVRDIFRTK